MVTLASCFVKSCVQQPSSARSWVSPCRARSTLLRREGPGWSISREGVRRNGREAFVNFLVFSWHSAYVNCGSARFASPGTFESWGSASVPQQGCQPPCCWAVETRSCHVSRNASVRIFFLVHVGYPFLSCVLAMAIIEVFAVGRRSARSSSPSVEVQRNLNCFSAPAEPSATASATPLEHQPCRRPDFVTSTVLCAFWTVGTCR